MSYVLALIVAALGGLLFFKKKQDTQSILAETQAKDQALAEQQKEVDAVIATLDAGITKMKAEREAEAKKQAEDNLSLKERRDRIRKGLQ